MSQVITRASHVFEVWKPNRDRSALQLASGSYGDHEGLRWESDETRFVIGDGLPGKVWSSQAPVLFDEFRVANFARVEAARSAGVEAGLGLPVFADGQFAAAFVILAGGTNSKLICEVWKPGSCSSHLELRAGYYGQYHRLCGISELAKFPYGQGLPGSIWQSGMPRIIENVGTSPALVRRTDARRDGLFSALGIPVATGDGLEVVLLFSPKEAPMARVMEIWTPDERNKLLRLRVGTYGALDDVRSASRGATLDVSDGLAGAVCELGLPLVVEDLSTIEESRAECLLKAGLTVGVGFPVFVQSRLKAVVVLLN